jgi:hypothetical protein
MKSTIHSIVQRLIDQNKLYDATDQFISAFDRTLSECQSAAFISFIIESNSSPGEDGGKGDWRDLVPNNLLLNWRGACQCANVPACQYSVPGNVPW